MNQIILVRHCEKDFDPKSTHIESDPVLTEKGVTQAQQVKEFLKDFNYEAIFSSIFIRGEQTAQILNEEKKVKYVRSMAFNEYFVRPLGGNVETTTMGVTRTMSKLYGIYDDYDSIVLVSHASIGRDILMTILNMKVEEAKRYNNNFGETIVLRFDRDQGDENWTIKSHFVPYQ